MAQYPTKNFQSTNFWTKKKVELTTFSLPTFKVEVHLHDLWFYSWRFLFTFY